MRFVVVQLSTRMHYAVPRILNGAGLLDRFFTDGVTSPMLKNILKLIPKIFVPSLVKRLAGRFLNDVKPEKIKSFSFLGLEYYLKKALARNSSEKTKTFLWAGKKIGQLVIKNGFGKASAIYCFNSAALEVMRAAKQNGIFCVLEQTISPQLNKLLLKEYSRWPGWEEPPANDRYLKEFVQREHEEWDLADLIVCGSEFVLNGIKGENGPVKKCVVVPYGVEAAGKVITEKIKSTEEPLKLLTVGAVGLRKGAPYLLELARSLPKVKFRWAGGLEITEKARKQMEEYIDLVGPVPRSEINDHYSWADAMILLSVCEGSATVIYEALRRGIPVICSENSGAPKIKSKGLHVVPTGDFEAVKKTLERLIDLNKKGRFPKVPNSLIEFVSYRAYSKRLISVFKSHIKSPN